MEKVFVDIEEHECLDFNEETVSVAELKLRIMNIDLSCLYNPRLQVTDQQGQITETDKYENKEMALILVYKEAIQLLLTGLKNYLTMWNKKI
jgi:hypothetical protein